MRTLLAVSLACALGASCRLYAPTVADCTLSCGEGGACPTGFTCRGTFCRPTAGPVEDCACRVGDTQACGQDGGECRQGTQLCSAAGAWGECLGAVGPSEETCDGKDNDCDGTVDVGPIVQLLDNTGPTEGFWRLHGTDAGYALVTPLAVENDPEYAVTRVLRFGRDFEPLGQSEPIHEGYWRRTDSFVDGESVYAVASVNDQADVELSCTAPDGTVTRLGLLPDAGYAGKIFVGLGARGLVTAFRSDVETVRVAKWPRDGGPPESVYDLPPLPEGEFSAFASTTDGRYVVLEHSLPDGGYEEAVVDVDSPDAGIPGRSYWEHRTFITKQDGGITHVDRLVPTRGGIPEPGTASVSKAILSFHHYADQAFVDALAVETEGPWADMEFILAADDTQVIVYADRETGLMKLAHVRGKGSNDQQASRRSLPADMNLPSGSTSGNLRLAKVPSDEMYGIAWVTGGKAYGRRVCLP